MSCIHKMHSWAGLHIWVSFLFKMARIIIQLYLYATFQTSMVVFNIALRIQSKPYLVVYWDASICQKWKPIFIKRGKSLQLCHSCLFYCLTYFSQLKCHRRFWRFVYVLAENLCWVYSVTLQKVLHFIARLIYEASAISMQQEGCNLPYLSYL